jgi:hypothetical protein
MSATSRFLIRGLIFTGLGVFLCIATLPLQTKTAADGPTGTALPSRAPSENLTQTKAHLVAPGRQIPGAPLAQLNLFGPKEPIAVNPAKAYPSVAFVPGFRPISYPANSLVDQLAHSLNGIVRLPPGDYSIPVRLY